MHEIVCVGDVHEGLNFDFRIDPETGISERALDLHGNFARAAQWAIEHRASLFCILGDLFDRAHVAPVFREMVRKDVIGPLGAAGIEVWILAGNHDEPRRTARSTSLDDYRGYAHVKVFRTPKVEIREIGGRKIGFILIPYMHPEQVVEQVRQTLGKEVPRELAYETARATCGQTLRGRSMRLCRLTSPDSSWGSRSPSPTNSGTGSTRNGSRTGSAAPSIMRSSSFRRAAPAS